MSAYIADVNMHMAFERTNDRAHKSTHILPFYYETFHRLEHEPFQIRRNCYQNAGCMCVNERGRKYMNMTMMKSHGRENVPSPIISI